MEITLQARKNRLLMLGTNKLEIDMPNLWINRFIEDKRLPEDQRFTWSTYEFYEKSDKLWISGLLDQLLSKK